LHSTSESDSRSNATPWSNGATRSRYPALAQDIDAEIAIVGGGLTGVTAALLLAHAKRRVVLLEGRELASGVTGASTAHLTEAIDTRYCELEKTFGAEGARLARRSSRMAIDQVAEWVSRLGIRCDFQRLPGFLFTGRAEHVDRIQAELGAARRAGAHVELGPVPAPFKARSAVRFEDQAQLDPVAYTLGLASQAAREGAQIFESTQVLEIEEQGDSVQLQTSGPRVTARYVIMATHAPSTKNLTQIKVAQYRSYVVAGAAKAALGALLWDTDDPYHYYRSANVGGQTQLIVGGSDHKTGQLPDQPPPYEHLARLCEAAGGTPSLRWSAQVVEPADGLPYIGGLHPGERVLVATGFGGNGTTFGSVAAMILSDMLLGRQSPYAELYRASRIKPLSSIGPLVKENADFPLHLVRDRMKRSLKSLADLRPGEGQIVELGGERLAAYRDDDGKVQAVSAICTHMGCLVAFNPVERSWDCPCHGSRFAPDGRVLDGPALKPLAPFELVEDEAREPGARAALR
jgi:glycine/D-amino acid oxidase-like deaminating enzyme/nitrite reductase/ring-hydroxylating ferredoxin subunit